MFFVVCLECLKGTKFIHDSDVIVGSYDIWQ